MAELKRINIDELKVGDEVGYCRYPTYGWNRKFRYPHVRKIKIARITPKRTKFVTEDGIEFDRNEASQFVVLNDDTTYSNEMANLHKSLHNMLYNIDDAKRKGVHLIEEKITDDEIRELHEAVSKIYNKYHDQYLKDK